MSYRYLDAPVSDLLEREQDIHFFCHCGHHITFGPEDFRRWPHSTLHRIAARMRCSVCGAIGDIPDIRITSSRSGMGKPYLRTHRPPCCPVGAFNGHA
jgi:hypothetical protein